MESVESIAAKIAHEDLVYLDYSPPVYQQVDRMALERAIAAALAAEREKRDVVGVCFDGTGASCTKVQEFLGGNKAEGAIVTWKNCTYDGGVLQTYRGPREFVPGNFIVQLSTGGLAVLCESVSTSNGPTVKRFDPVVTHDRDEHGVNYFAEMEPDPSGEWVRFSDMQAAMEAERAKFAAFADEQGDPRKVAGNGIPVSADGVFLTPGAIVWPHGDVFIDDDEEGGTVKWNVLDNNTGDLVSAEEWDAAKCYSTKEAATSALAAAKEKP